jgi:hypothetical protein
MAYSKATDVNAHALVINSDSGIPALRATSIASGSNEGPKPKPAKIRAVSFVLTRAVV